VELRDLIVTPLIIMLVYVGAYIARSRFTDAVNRRYFIPALTAKILGALALGFIYQFYYDGGDTYNYHTHGSRHVWEAFMDNPEKGIKLLVNAQGDYTGVYQYASQISFFRDPQSYVVVRIASLFDLLTFSSYSATAILFSVVGFIGGWMFFLAFYEIRPHLHRGIALATLFIPSVIFWGSGLLKDTITMACVGAATFAVFRMINYRVVLLRYVALLIISLYALYSIKIYILLTFLPSIILWIFLKYFQQIRSMMLRVLISPMVLVMATFSGYFAIVKASQDNPKYSLNAIAQTAQVTAYDIRYWTGKDAGSGYTLGELDGSWQSMVKLAPQAINVSIFRPYLWEVRNPLMLLSAIESVILLGLTFYAIYRCRYYLFRAISDPAVLFCLVFSLSFAFAVGVSTFNFGTLARYKIPLLPFYLMGLIFMLDYSNRARKVDLLDSTE